MLDKRPTQLTVLKRGAAFDREPFSVHAALLVATLVAFSDQTKFQDAQESVPVEVITDQQFSQNIQDPHRMLQCAGEPRVFWVQHHNGIFRWCQGNTCRALQDTHTQQGCCAIDA